MHVHQGGKDLGISKIALVRFPNSLINFEFLFSFYLGNTGWRENDCNALKSVEKIQVCSANCLGKFIRCQELCRLQFVVFFPLKYRAAHFPFAFSLILELIPKFAPYPPFYSDPFYFFPLSSETTYFFTRSHFSFRFSPLQQKPDDGDFCSEKIQNRERKK